MTDADRNIDEATKAATEAARGTADRVGDTATESAARLSDAAFGAADKISDTASDAADAFSATAHAKKAELADTIDTISHQATAAVSSAKEGVNEGVAYVKERYRENPGLVIAIGAAALIGVVTVVKAITRR
jgi:gas vesicle protein